MIFGSVCSGIEAASAAWHPLGWRAAWYSEIEPFPCAVLKHRYPDTPNLGDMTKIHESEIFNGSAIDVLVGGTPCQSFSIAGLREGLGDPRGNLALVFLALLNRKRPRWVVWENVPGVLSSWSDEAGSFAPESLKTGGHPDRERGWQSNDFDTFTSGLRELGYGLAWRVLDAQYFGVPQRRQRVFVVGHLGDWRPAASVLFESHSLSGHPAPRREAGQKVAGTIRAGSGGGCGPGPDEAAQGNLIAKPVLTHRRDDASSENFIAHTLRGEGFDASEDGTGHGTPLVPIAFGSKDSGADAGEISPTLRAGGHDKSHANAGAPPAVCYDMRGNGDGDSAPTLTGHHAGAVSDFSPMVFQQNSRSEVRKVGGDGGVAGAVTGEPGAQCQNYVAFQEVAGTLKAGGIKSGTPNGAEEASRLIGAGPAVRRLTPRECERLQGFPDDYTLIPYRGGVAADGPRYKACGNSMAVPVMRWIGERIAMADSLVSKKSKRMWPE